MPELPISSPSPEEKVPELNNLTEVSSSSGPKDAEAFEPADMTTYSSPEISRAPHGPREQTLGVAVDRNLRDASLDASPTANHYSSVGNFVSIDIEKDEKLFNFLSRIKAKVQAVFPETKAATIDKAEAVTVQVVEQTPQIDGTGELHDHRHLSLGEALEQPVECVDRALAMEASLKIFGYSDARTLFAVDEHPGGKVNHADVWFTLGGESFVAVTMGDLAGRVLPLDLYADTYIPLREEQGLGKRILKENWSQRHYFTALPSRDTMSPEAARMT